MGETGDVYRWLDEHLARLASDAGAEPLDAPETVARATLERGGYFHAFPDVAIPASHAGEYLPPAACYHVYSRFAGSSLETPRLLTLAATCGRREPAAPGRFESFRMREVVFVGPPPWVEEQRRGWMEKAAAFASAAGLAGDMQPATDLFFGAENRGRRLMQQLKNLKYELRVDVRGVGPLAIASFNLHETYFTSRFDLQMADGSPAVSGCAAFGIDRWALACTAHMALERR